MKIRILIPTILVFAISVAAQIETNKITPEEYREANLIARKITKRLLQTKDIQPLIKEFFIHDYIQRLNKDDSDTPFLRTEQLTPERRHMRARFYLAEINWLYLTILYSRSNPNPAPEGDDPLPHMPKAVRTFAKRNQAAWNALIDNEQAVDRNKIWTNVEANKYFDNSLLVLESTAPMLRRQSIKIKAGYTSMWRKNIAELERDLGSYEPWGFTCDTDCHGFPAGTRIIHVGMHLFQITLVRVKGQLKVVGFDIEIP